MALLPIFAEILELPLESVSGRSTHQSDLELDRAVLELVRKLRRRLSVEGSMLKLEIGHIEAVRVRGDEESLRRVMLIHS